MATFIPEPGSVASDSGGGVEPWAGAGEVREHASSCVTRHTSGLHGPLRPIRAGAMVRHIALFAGLGVGLVSCVTRLDDLEANWEGEETSALATGRADSGPATVSTSDESSSDSATQGTPTPSTPPADCADGLLNSEGFCIPQVRCAPGTFVSEVDGARVCSPCASGFFSNEYDAAECQRWRSCSAGQYVASAGSASTDRTCAACPEGTTSTSENAGACTGASDCEAGTYQSNDECIACSPGNYCSGQTQSETPCSADTWDEDNDPATPCIVKTSCAPGQFVHDEGTTLKDRSCSFCGDELFSTESNAVGCAAWSTCESGTYVSLQGTSTSDRECKACPDGTFSTETNVATCQEWQDCSAPTEYASAEPSSERDRTCRPCPAGYLSDDDNATSCDLQVPVNLVNNYDFESNANGWTSWVGSVSVSSNRAHTGSRSLLVTGAGTGPAATRLDSVVEPGATYDVSFWVNIGRVATTPVNITRELSCNGSVTYVWLANNPAVANGVWTQLSGTFTIPASCASPKVQVYAEGTGSNVDLYVDDVSVTKAP